MIAYFALLSFVPLLFLTISALSLAGRPDESSYLVTELKRAFPGSSISSIVHTVREIQNHATALGIVGAAGLLWTSLSLFSVLESAFNIVYGQPNRSFLRGKLLAVGADAGLARDALLRVARGLDRVRPAHPLRGRGRRQLVRRLRALGGRLDDRGLRLPVRGLLPADERRALVPGRPAGHDRRRGAAGGELPGAADLRALLEQRRRAEGLRRPGAAARLAVRDGERDRLRRRGELALRAEAPPAWRPTSRRQPGSPRRP